MKEYRSNKKTKPKRPQITNCLKDISTLQRVSPTIIRRSSKEITFHLIASKMKLKLFSSPSHLIKSIFFLPTFHLSPYQIKISPTSSSKNNSTNRVNLETSLPEIRPFNMGELSCYWSLLGRYIVLF